MIGKKALSKLSVKTLEGLLASKKRLAAIAPLEQKRAKLLQQLKKVEKRLEKLSGSAPAKVARKPRFSAAARRKIALAQKRRWAKVRALKKAQATA